MKDKKKYIILGIATVLLMVLIVFLVGRSFGFFKYIKKGDVTNVITISGIKVEVQNPENDALNLENAYPMRDEEGLTLTPFVFTMTNTSNKSLSYAIRVDNDTDKQQSCALEDQTICPVLTTNYIKYSYKKNDGTYSEPALLSNNGNIITSGSISGGETITSSIILWINSEAGNEIQNHYFFGKIIITGEQYVEKNLQEAILNANSIIEAEPTLTNSSNNTSDASGLYKSTATNDGSPTYYFRGNVENNYVSFAGYMWRIVRINEDGTIRLIMENGINNNATYKFNSNYNNKIYMYYTNSQAKTELENWYENNIVDNGYSSNIVTGNYFCEQAKVAYDQEYASNSETSMIAYSSYTPIFKCSTDENGYGIVNSNVGLITYDEVVFAGGYYGQVNNDYHLYNEKAYWTMSPSGIKSNVTHDWFISSAGHINNINVTGNIPIRPVINLKADTVVTGSGTSNNPYQVLNERLTIGESVTAIDGSKWHVLENSDRDSVYVTLLSDYNLNNDGTYNTSCGKDIDGAYDCSTVAFDSDGTNVYDENDGNNVGYFIKNTYAPLVTNSLPGTSSVTLPTASQIAIADGQNFVGNTTLLSSWLLTTNYWTKTSHLNANVVNLVYNVKYTLGLNNNYADVSNIYGARPVITTLKSNLVLD